jgi:glycosyltransferase involved in cell wall biosynthesis
LFGWHKYKLAFWGHGKNMQVLPTKWGKFKEYIKYLTTKRVDWWFVYSGLSQNIVQKIGFAEDKITNVENSIDTVKLINYCIKVTQEETMFIREKLQLGDGPVGLYIGSLYEDKRLDFLLSACLLILEIIPNFRLIVMGDGPQRAYVENAQAQYPWLNYVGRQTEQEKARYLRLASIILNPGLVGLGILDGFAAGIPIVTTDCGLHSPEIDYLRNGENGFMTKNTLEDYVETVLEILNDPELASHLRLGCQESAKHYTLQNMANNFRLGILKALN